MSATANQSARGVELEVADAAEAPPHQGDRGLEELLAVRCELVDDGADLGGERASDEPVRLQVAQPLGEEAFADARQALQQLAVAAGAEGDVVGMVLPGTAHGEAEVLLGRPSAFDLVAATPASVLSLPAQVFHGLLAEPAFARSVAHRMARATLAAPLPTASPVGVPSAG